MQSEEKREGMAGIRVNFEQGGILSLTAVEYLRDMRSMNLQAKAFILIR